MAQAVSRRPLTAEALFRSRVSLCGICVGQSGTGTGFSPNTSVFRSQFHSTGAPLLGKMKKLIIFHLHHRVAQEALILRCVCSFCCGALLKKKKPEVLTTPLRRYRFWTVSGCVLLNITCYWSYPRDSNTRTATFNILQFYVLPTHRLCLSYDSHNKQRLFP
jgi:hypothetical protein